MNISITREIHYALKNFLENEYNRRNIGNRDLENAVAAALRSAPVQEALSSAIDFFLSHK